MLRKDTLLLRQIVVLEVSNKFTLLLTVPSTSLSLNSV
jgi:hypothetical protein